jgi:hypothetical protein
MLAASSSNLEVSVSGRPSPHGAPNETFTPRATESVFDDDGRLLADVRLVPDGADQRGWEMEPVSPAPFLDYYFGRGGHVVRLGGRDTVVRARLGTSWRDGRRIWLLELNPHEAGSNSGGAERVQ